MNIFTNSRFKKIPFVSTLVFLILVFPLLYPDSFTVTLLVFVGIYVIVCTGLSLIFGFAGQLSLTQAAFYGIGAYSSALMTTKYSLPFWIGFSSSAILPALVAFIIGWPILRLKHFYLAMATLAFSEITMVFFIQEIDITGGPTGITRIPPAKLFGIVFDTPVKYFFLVWILALSILWFANNLIESKIGRSLRAISDNEIAASAMGINIAAMKTFMFVMSAILAGIGGSLYVHFVSFVNPDPFSVSLSVLLVIMVAVGGVRSLWGSVLGAIFITILPSLLGAYKQYSMLIYGTILILILMFLPDGIAGLIVSIIKNINLQSKSLKE